MVGFGRTGPFLYSAGAMNNLPPGLIAGLAINASGQVAGSGYLWTPSTPNGTTGSLTPLGTLGGNSGDGHGINASGQVVGVANNHAFLSQGSSMQDLGSGEASSINASGQVVGGSNSSPFPFLYSDGVRTNLNTLIDPASGWVLDRATGINDSGWITGSGTIGGITHAYLLIPLPPGDYNKNGTVDAADYTIWRDNFGTVVTQCSGPDGDCNGFINSTDYQIWKDHFGETLPIGAGHAAAVPEPPTFLLSVLTLAGLAPLRRKLSATRAIM